MPKAQMCTPIERRLGYRITCYKCGYVFVSFAETLKIGWAHCGVCNATNYIVNKNKETEDNIK